MPIDLHKIYIKKSIKEPEEMLLSGAEVAKAWSLNVATIRRWKDAGAPHHEIRPGLFRYRLGELREWLAKRPKRKLQGAVAAK